MFTVILSYTLLFLTPFNSSTHLAKQNGVIPNHCTLNKKHCGYVLPDQVQK